MIAGILCIVVVILLFILAIYLIIIGVDEGTVWKPICGLIILFIIIPTTIAITATYYEEDKVLTPQAIDVYRGNTTLEITYRDSVPVDSVVVFKNN